MTCSAGLRPSFSDDRAWNGRARHAWRHGVTPRCRATRPHHSTAGSITPESRHLAVSEGHAAEALSAANTTGRGELTRASALQYRLAGVEDWWGVADVHCCAFYPKAAACWRPLLRLDRVVSMRVGSESKLGRFACLVAVGDLQGQQGAAQGSSKALVPMGTFVDLFSAVLLPDSMQVNYASTHQARGIQGAVVVDTLNLFVPGKQITTLNGNIREVKRKHIAYLSNLAVAPGAQRLGIGRQLLLQGEDLARGWGCRCVALHVDATNDAARQLYTQEGYREVVRQSEWDRLLEGRRTPLVLMLKRLTSKHGGGE